MLTVMLSVQCLIVIMSGFILSNVMLFDRHPALSMQTMWSADAYPKAATTSMDTYAREH